MSDMNSVQTLPQKKISAFQMLLLCAVGIMINIAGVRIASEFDVPLYLDTAGTMLTAVAAGGLPGIIVGFITNMLKGLFITEGMYYGVLNMFTAIMASFFAKKGAFRNFFLPLLTIPAFAIVTGVLSAVLTWFLNGCQMGGIALVFAQYFYDNTPLDYFLSQLCGDISLELIDKSLNVVLVALLLLLVPKSMRGNFRPDAQDSERAAAQQNREKTACRLISLRTKIILILTAASLLIAVTSTAISFVLFKNSTREEHIKLANGITELAASVIDGNRVNEFIEKGDSFKDYSDTEKMLYKLRNSSPDIEYLYAYKIEKDGCHVIFDLDTDELKGEDPGTVVPFDETFLPYVPKLLEGGEIEPIISDDAYGWLLTVYKPVYDDLGICRCYVAADVSMNLLSQYGYGFITRMLSLFVSFFILSLVCCAALVNRSVIRPINKMAYSAGAFVYGGDSAEAENVGRIKALNIRTGDEIENLYNAFVSMTQQSVEYVEEIERHNETISQMQNGLIMVLADIVESRDKCTGDHVRKTAAYVRIIVNKMKEMGLYADQLTDRFIKDVINSAPLHDIGKIHVPDNILNKPGKLTDEEFEIMKEHTTVGSSIIQQAIDMVPESGYLEEAKNLAEYHHEKWNGKGYPNGIQGEQIPLSARIMAVADVFDALVSRRSYKKPFSFEKAMSIIQEDAGTHFDPLVAKAFVASADEVKKVMEEFDRISNPYGEEIDVDGSSDQKR